VWPCEPNPNSPHRIDRTGFGENPDVLAAAPYFSSFATVEVVTAGFRLASPAPPVPSVSPLGLFIAAADLIGAGAYLRRRA